MGENTVTNQQWLTIPEAANHIRLKVDTIREYMYTGQLKVYKVGAKRTARVRIKLSDLESLLIPYAPAKGDDGVVDDD